MGGDDFRRGFMAIISGFKCSSSSVTEFGWKSYTSTSAVFALATLDPAGTVLVQNWDQHVQLSLKSFVVNASLRVTTFGCFICLHFSIAENDSWLDTLYPVRQHWLLFQLPPMRPADLGSRWPSGLGGDSPSTLLKQ